MKAIVNAVFVIDAPKELVFAHVKGNNINRHFNTAWESFSTGFNRLEEKSVVP